MDEQCSSNISTVEAKTTTSPNDESLHISTSSSWTILQTDRAEALDSGSGVSSLELNAMKMQWEKNNEIEEAGRKQEQDSTDNYEHKTERLVDNLDNQAEDVSDGISIISDCDSTGRLSPNPFLREQNLKFGSEHELPPIHNLYESGQQIRDRRNFLFEQDDPTQSQETVPMTRPTIVGYRLLSFVQNGLTAVFYVGATLAILAFIGRLRNPEWKVLGEEKPLADIEQRLVDLEMQNNLMRAEIDLMSKQLLHLNTIANSRDQAHTQSQRRKTKTFMAWPGNGNSMEALDVTKKDLKQPYKCSDGKYVEIAAMCVEIKPDVKSIEEDIGNNGHVPYSKADAFKEHHKMKHVYKQDHYMSSESESKESYSTNQDKSKKRFGKQHTKKRHGEDDHSSSGDWHERMMQHREHSRERREDSQNNNWYIKRGGSREHKRSTEFRR